MAALVCSRLMSILVESLTVCSRGINQPVKFSVKVYLIWRRDGKHFSSWPGTISQTLELGKSFKRIGAATISTLT